MGSEIMIGAIIGKKFVQSQYDLLNRGDITTFMKGIDEDATYIYPGDIPISGETKGKKAIEEWFHKVWEHFPKISITLKNIFVTNVSAFGSTNVFATEWVEDVTSHGGREFRFSGVTVIEVKKGKATYIREYIFDTEIEKIAWGG